MCVCVQNIYVCVYIFSLEKNYQNHATIVSVLCSCLLVGRFGGDVHLSSFRHCRPVWAAGYEPCRPRSVNLSRTGFLAPPTPPCHGAPCSAPRGSEAPPPGSQAPPSYVSCTCRRKTNDLFLLTWSLSVKLSLCQHHKTFSGQHMKTPTQTNQIYSDVRLGLVWQRWGTFHIPPARCRSSLKTGPSGSSKSRLNPNIYHEHDSTRTHLSVRLQFSLGMQFVRNIRRKQELLTIPTVTIK